MAAHRLHHQPVTNDPTPHRPTYHLPPSNPITHTPYSRNRRNNKYTTRKPQKQQIKPQETPQTPKNFQNSDKNLHVHDPQGPLLAALALAAQSPPMQGTLPDPLPTREAPWDSWQISPTTPGDEAVGGGHTYIYMPSFIPRSELIPRPLARIPYSFFFFGIARPVGTGRYGLSRRSSDVKTLFCVVL